MPLRELPNLDQLQGFTYMGGHLRIIMRETRVDRCDDPACDLPHEVEPVDVAYDVEPNAENLAQLAEYLFTDALLYAQNVPLPTPESPDEPADRLRWLLTQNIVGASDYDQAVIQAATPAVVRTVLRLASTVETAITGA